jgi:UDP-GlcNAc:undecaprenyl-phosphate GlcNAc-1-phosphate transferase
VNDAWPALAAAFAAAAAATVLLRAFAIRVGLVSHPNPIVPQHVAPVAYLGGPAVAIGIAAAIALAPAHAPPPWLLVPALGFLLLGIIDDLRPLQPAPKLALQAVVASAAPLMGAALDVTGSAPFDGVIVGAWILLVVNAYNLTDVSDGLAASIASAALIAWALFGPSEGMVTAAIAAAAFLGFLPFNWPRASIYLGDAGSHLAGFLVAALVLVPAGPSAPPPAFLPLIAAVPLFEVALLILLRTRYGLPVWRGSPHHFALLLQERGWTRPWINLLAAAASATFAGVAAAG